MPERVSSTRRMLGLAILLSFGGCSTDVGPLPEIHNELNRLLIEAVEKRDDQAVNGLLRRGAAPDSTGSGVRGGTAPTALLLAVQRRSPEIVRALISAGADVNLQSGHHLNTPLFQAVVMGEKELVALLLDSGASIDRGRPAEPPAPPSGRGDPHPGVHDPLIAAIWIDREDIALFLLSRGATPQPRHLTVAIRGRNLRVVDALLRSGARRDWVVNGRTMMQEAAALPPGVSRTRIAAMLQSGG